MKKNKKILIVYSTYNDTHLLLSNAIKELNKRNQKYKVLKVPGAFEIPVAIVRKINKYDGFIAIGSIIKGETPNFDYISNSITNAIMHLSITFKKPIGNAILTCLNNIQVKKRYGKGKEAVDAVCDVLDG
jgi:6,7-dimethyl-8-ribityllumazine synthase